MALTALNLLAGERPLAIPGALELGDCNGLVELGDCSEDTDRASCAPSARKISATRDEHDRGRSNPPSCIASLQPPRRPQHRTPTNSSPSCAPASTTCGRRSLRQNSMRRRGALLLSASRRNAHSQRRALTRNRPCNSPSSSRPSRHAFAARGAGCARRGRDRPERAHCLRKRTPAGLPPLGGRLKGPKRWPVHLTALTSSH